MARKKKSSLLGALFALLVTKPRARAKAKRESTREFDLRVQKGARVAAERARAKADRERERAHRLTEQASRARLRRVEAPARAKAATAEKRAEQLDDLAHKIESGQVRGSELRDLVASGRLNIRAL